MPGMILSKRIILSNWKKIGFYDVKIQVFWILVSRVMELVFLVNGIKDSADLNKVDLEEIYSTVLKNLYDTLVEITNSCFDGSFSITLLDILS